MIKKGTPKQHIHGVLLLDKLGDISSNKALQQVKHAFHAKKAGHTGSLDPLATGILPICLGEATKFATYLLADHKTYVATVALGQTTTTLDSEGEITGEYATKHITTKLILQALKQFSGKITQVPPMFSALKVEGTPLYRLAREGKEIERKERKVEIYSLELMHFKNNTITLKAHVSKGTYIRTLADDLGRALHSGAYITKLRRVGFGEFDIAHSVTFEELQDSNEPTSLLLPVGSIISSFVSVALSREQLTELQFGRKIIYSPHQTDTLDEGSMVKMFFNEVFVGLGVLGEEHITPKRLINFELFTDELR